MENHSINKMVAGLLFLQKIREQANIEDKRIKHVSPMRDNDGRYFYMNKSSATIFISQNRQKIGQKLTLEKPHNHTKNKSQSL